MPDQKEPKRSSSAPVAGSWKRFGSMALKPEAASEATTGPTSVHAGAASDGVVASPMALAALPKDDAA